MFFFLPGSSLTLTPDVPYATLAILPMSHRHFRIDDAPHLSCFLSLSLTHHILPHMAHSPVLSHASPPLFFGISCGQPDGHLLGAETLYYYYY